MPIDEQLDQEQCLDIAQRCACFHIRKAARAVTGVFDQALESTGLSSTQFVILIGVRLSEPAPMADLADLLAVDRSTLTRNLRPLLKRGLLSCDTAPGKRHKMVELTEPGRERLEQAGPMWQRAQSTIESAIGADRWPGLLNDLGGLSGLANGNGH